MPRYLALDFIHDLECHKRKFLDRSLLAVPGANETEESTFNNASFAVCMRTLLANASVEYDENLSLSPDEQEKNETGEQKLEAFEANTNTESDTEMLVPISSSADSILEGSLETSVFECLNEEVLDHVLGATANKSNRSDDTLQLYLLEELCEEDDTRKQETVDACSLSRKLRPVKIPDPFTQLRLKEEIVIKKDRLYENVCLKLEKEIGEKVFEFMKVCVKDDSFMLEEVYPMTDESSTERPLTKDVVQSENHQWTGSEFAIKNPDESMAEDLKDINDVCTEHTLESFHGQMEEVHNGEKSSIAAPIERTSNKPSDIGTLESPLSEEDIPSKAPCTELCSSIGLDIEDEVMRSMNCLSPDSFMKLEKKIRNKEKTFDDMLSMLLPEPQDAVIANLDPVPLPESSVWKPVAMENRLEAGLSWDPVPAALLDMHRANFTEFVDVPKILETGVAKGQYLFLKKEIPWKVDDAEIADWRLEEKKALSLQYITSLRRPCPGEGIRSTKYASCVPHGYLALMCGLPQGHRQEGDIGEADCLARRPKGESKSENQQFLTPTPHCAPNEHNGRARDENTPSMQRVHPKSKFEDTFFSECTKTEVADSNCNARKSQPAKSSAVMQAAQGSQSDDCKEIADSSTVLLKGQESSKLVAVSSFALADGKNHSAKNVSPLDDFVLLRTGRSHTLCGTNTSVGNISMMPPVTIVQAAKVRPLQYENPGTEEASCKVGISERGLQNKIVAVEGDKADQLRSDSCQLGSWTNITAAAESSALCQSAPRSEACEQSVTVVEVYLNKEFAHIIATVEKDAQAVWQYLSDIKRLPPTLSLASCTSDVTRFMLKEELSKFDSKSKEADSLKAAICLHALVEVLDLVMNCNVLSACGVLKALSHKFDQHLGSCLEPVRRKLADFHCQNQEKGVFHPKFVKLQQILSYWMQTNPSSKILILIHRYFNCLASPLQIFLTSFKSMIVGVYPNHLEDAAEISAALSPFNVILAEETASLQRCPWETLDYVVQYEYRRQSCWHEMVFSGNPRLKGFLALWSKRSDVEIVSSEQNVAKGGLDLKPEPRHVLLCSNTIIQNRSLLVDLEQKQNVVLISRDYTFLARTLPARFRNVLLQPDILIDERSCIVLFSASSLDTENDMLLAQQKVLSVMMKSRKLYVMLIHSESLDHSNASGGVKSRYVNIARFVSFANETALLMDGAAVEVIHIFSTSETASMISSLCGKVKEKSTVWRPEEWSDRQWLTEEMSEHEKFLLCLPFMNSFSAQLMLRIAPLSTLLRMDLAELKRVLKWLPECSLQAFYDATHTGTSAQSLWGSAVNNFAGSHPTNIGYPPATDLLEQDSRYGVLVDDRSCINSKCFVSNKENLANMALTPSTDNFEAFSLEQQPLPEFLPASPFYGDHRIVDQRNRGYSLGSAGSPPQAFIHPHKETSAFSTGRDHYETGLAAALRLSVAGELVDLRTAAPKSRKDMEYQQPSASENDDLIFIKDKDSISEQEVYRSNRSAYEHQSEDQVGRRYLRDCISVRNARSQYPCVRREDDKITKGGPQPAADYFRAHQQPARTFSLGRIQHSNPTRSFPQHRMSSVFPSPVQWNDPPVEKNRPRQHVRAVQAEAAQVCKENMDADMNLPLDLRCREMSQKSLAKLKTPIAKTFGDLDPPRTTSMKYCKKRKLTFEKVPGTRDGQTRLAFV